MTANLMTPLASLAGWRPRLLLFDLDGTLADTAPDLIGALQFIRAQLGLAPIDAARVRGHVSKGGRAVLRVGIPELSAAAAESHLDALLARYREYICIDTRLFDGIEVLLDRWRREGGSAGIVTNKSSTLTAALLAELGVRETFASVVCGDTLAERKPHPAPVLHACAIAGAAARDTLFIGDDRRDIEAGRAAGTRTASAEWGYLETGDPADWSADLRFASPDDFSAWLW